MKRETVDDGILIFISIHCFHPFEILFYVPGCGGRLMSIKNPSHIAPLDAKQGFCIIKNKVILLKNQ